MKRIIALTLTALALLAVSCRKVDSGTVTITNTLSEQVRVTLSENYETETMTLAPGETVARDYDHYGSVYLPDETPRATVTESGDDYTIVPLAATPLKLYVTNDLGTPVTLVNAKESDTAEYAIPSGARNLAVDFSYYHQWTLAVKDATDGSYSIKKTVVTTTTGKDTDEEKTVDTTYILVTTPGN